LSQKYLAGPWRGQPKQDRIAHHLLDKPVPQGIEPDRTSANTFVLIVAVAGSHRQAQSS